jgi:thiamine-monophosphate kinase
VAAVTATESPQPGQTSIGALGEFGLIEAITTTFVPGRGVLLGPGDDAAVLTAPDARVVATTDLLVEGRHFRRDWSSAQDVGHRAAAANLADIAAMGAVPTGLLVGLAAPAELPVAWAQGLAQGLAEEAFGVGASVVGGDVVRADVITVAVTALGDLQGRAPVTRAGARPGDLVAVAGRLGWAAAGLALLSRGFRTARALVDAHRRPLVPYAEGPRASELGATAMCDVSDGLIADLGHVAEASDVSVVLDPGAFDVPARMAEVAASMGVDPLQWVLTGGDDHALAACFPPDVVLPESWRIIGRVVETLSDGPRVRLADGSRPSYEDSGWDHFR